MPTVYRQDLFSPTLLVSPPLIVTDEQLELLRRICGIGSSDSQFANKQYDAIVRILTAGITPVPKISSLNPNSAIIGGTELIEVTVTGSEFQPGLVLLVGGLAHPYTYVSESELTVQLSPLPYTVTTTVSFMVLNGNVISDSAYFQFNFPE